MESMSDRKAPDLAARLVSNRVAGVCRRVGELLEQAYLAVEPSCGEREHLSKLLLLSPMDALCVMICCCVFINLRPIGPLGGLEPPFVVPSSSSKFSCSEFSSTRCPCWLSTMINLRMMVGTADAR